MIVADAFRPGTFVDALQFIVDNWSFLLGKAVEQLELAGAALGIALVQRLERGAHGISSATRSQKRSISPSVLK